MTDSDFNRAGWVRSQLIRNPEITLEQLQREYDKGSSRPRNMRPNNVQIIYQGRTQVRKRWGLDAADLPRKPDGKINVSALVRLYLDMFPDHTASEAEPYFETDGIKLKPNQFASIRSTWKSKKGDNAVVKTEQPTGSPDENQDAGPRARKRAPQGRRKGTGKKKREEMSSEEQRRERYEVLENSLDKLIAEAGDLRNPALAKVLKDARRRASAGVLQYEE